MDLIPELKRRNVIRTAALYVVAAWLIMQVAEVIIALAGLPDWTGRALLIILAVGFPIALIFSWVFEISTGTIRLESHSKPNSRAAELAGRRLDFVVISLLSAAILVFAADKWWPKGPFEQQAPAVNTITD